MQVDVLLCIVEFAVDFFWQMHEQMILDLRDPALNVIRKFAFLCTTGDSEEDGNAAVEEDNTIYGAVHKTSK